MARVQSHLYLLTSRYQLLKTTSRLFISAWRVGERDIRFCSLRTYAFRALIFFLVIFNYYEYFGLTIRRLCFIYLFIYLFNFNFLWVVQLRYTARIWCLQSLTSLPCLHVAGIKHLIIFVSSSFLFHGRLIHGRLSILAVCPNPGLAPKTAWRLVSLLIAYLLNTSSGLKIFVVICFSDTYELFLRNSRAISAVFCLS